MTHPISPAQLSQFELFAGLRTEDLSAVAQRMEPLRLRRHFQIFYPGQQAEFLYFVVEGVVKISQLDDEYREVIKFVHRAGAHFGELGLAGESQRVNYATLQSSDVHLLRIPLTDFRQLMQAVPGLQLAVLTHIARRLRRAEQKLESLVLHDARQRIVAYIKESAERYGRNVGYERTFRHYLTQQDIANYTGTSRQTVTSVLNELKKENRITFDRRRFLVRDMATLR